MYYVCILFLVQKGFGIKVMISNLMANYFDTAAVILFVIGFATLLFNKNLIKKIIGFNIMDTAIYLFLAAQGFVEGRKAPIVVNGIQEMEAYINPIPSGLVLTGIVVSVSVSALMLSMTVVLYSKYHTLDLDEILMKVKQEEIV